MPDDADLTPTPDATPDPLAAALAALAPAAPAFDRNALLFDAGRASRDRDVTFWRRVAGGFGVLAVAAAGWCGFALTRPAPEPRVEVVERVVEKVVEKVVEIPAPSPPSAADPVPLTRADPSSVGNLRDVALTRGVDALPARPVAATVVLTAGSSNWR